MKQCVITVKRNAILIVDMVMEKKRRIAVLWVAMVIAKNVDIIGISILITGK